MSPVVAALLFHAPGVRLLAHRRLSRRLLKLNAAAVLVTLIAMAGAGLAWGPWAVLVAWAVGHLAWSVTMAVLIHREGAGPLDGPMAP